MSNKQINTDIFIIYSGHCTIGFSYLKAAYEVTAINIYIIPKHNHLFKRYIFENKSHKLDTWYEYVGSSRTIMLQDSRIQFDDILNLASDDAKKELFYHINLFSNSKIEEIEEDLNSRPVLYKCINARSLLDL